MNGTDTGPEKFVHPFHLLRRWMAVLGLLVLAAGCTAPLISIGEQTQTQNLDRLVSERSTAADVSAALGEPRGYGRARYTKDQPLRNVWFYEFMQIKGDQVSVKILLVFFRGDRYDGYLWFSAKELLTGIPS
jgi:hypothetical protein